jgi:hypothetical protein
VHARFDTCTAYTGTANKADALTWIVTNKEPGLCLKMQSNPSGAGPASALQLAQAHACAPYDHRLPAEVVACACTRGLDELNRVVSRLQVGCTAAYATLLLKLQCSASFNVVPSHYTVPLELCGLVNALCSLTLL